MKLGRIIKCEWCSKEIVKDYSQRRFCGKWKDKLSCARKFSDDRARLYWHKHKKDPKWREEQRIRSLNKYYRIYKVIKLKNNSN